MYKKYISLLALVKKLSLKKRLLMYLIVQSLCLTYYLLLRFGLLFTEIKAFIL